MITEPAAYSASIASLDMNSATVVGELLVIRFAGMNLQANLPKLGTSSKCNALTAVHVSTDLEQVHKIIVALGISCYIIIVPYCTCLFGGLFPFHE